MRGKQNSPTIYQDLVPDDMECITCNLTKGDVNFPIVKHKEYWTVGIQCNTCKAGGIPLPKTSGKRHKHPIVRDFRIKDLPIKTRIAMYFAEKDYTNED